MDDTLITIGKIVNTQGHRGILKIFPLTDFPDRFLEMREVLVELGGRAVLYHIEESSLYKKYVLIKFKEILDMTMAEKLKGSLLKVPRQELKPLPEDSFYIFDIVGLKVYDTGGNFLGQVGDIIQTGANDVYVVDREGAKPLLIPALKKVVRELDVPGGRMTVEMLEEDKGPKG